jgi:hypothetical protein
MTVKIEKKLPKSQTYTWFFNNNVLEVLEEIDKTDIKTIGILMLLILFGP